MNHRRSSSRKFSNLFLSTNSNNSNTMLPVDRLVSSLDQLHMTSKLTLKIVDSQRRSADGMAKWSRESGNSAIDDVMHRTSQLMHMFADIQTQFSREFDRSIKELHKMANADKVIYDAEQRIEELRKREAKLRKDIDRGVSLFWNRKGGDLCLMRQQLAQVVIDKTNAERELRDTEAEMEVIRMFYFRHGMFGLADAYREMATGCKQIFDCHREITELVPAVSTQDVRRMQYDGAEITRNRVDQVRHRLVLDDHSGRNVPRRRSEPTHRREQQSSPNRHRRDTTPPPPYSEVQLRDGGLVMNQQRMSAPQLPLYPKLPSNPYRLTTKTP